MLIAPTAPVASRLIEQGTPPTSQFGCGFLPPKIVLDLDDLLLEIERLEVVRHRHQVGLGRQLVGRVAPVAVAERPELAGLDELLQPALQVAEVAGRRLRPAARSICASSEVFFGSAPRAVTDVDPVERVQVIEVHQMVLRIAASACIRLRMMLALSGILIVERVFHRAHRGERVHARAHAADALDEGPGVARIAALEDDLESAPHRAGRDGVADDVLVVDVDLDAQVPLDAGDRIDDDAPAAVVELEALGSR